MNFRIRPFSAFTGLLFLLNASIIFGQVQHDLLAAGAKHVVGIDGEGRLEAWGSNEYDQCEVPQIGNAVAVAAGDHHSLALDTEGNVYAWGRNADGQCDVPSGLKAAAIAAGGSHSVAINSEGHLVAWGNNRFNQSAIPRVLQTLKFIAVQAGANHNIAIAEDGSLRGWGSSNAGESSPPRDVWVKALDCSGPRCIALQKNGELVQWGSALELNAPKYAQFQDVAVGSDFIAAVMEDGSWQVFYDQNRTKADIPVPTSMSVVPGEFAASETLFAWRDGSGEVQVRAVPWLGHEELGSIHPETTVFAENATSLSQEIKAPPVQIERKRPEDFVPTNPFQFQRSQTDEVQSIAIIPVAGNQQCEGASRDAADLLPLAETALLGNYQVLEREMIDEALEEVRLSLSGITSEEHVLEAGRIKNAQAYAFIERICVDQEYALRLKLIDCETTELIWSALGLGMKDSEFFQKVSSALQAP